MKNVFPFSTSRPRPQREIGLMLGRNWNFTDSCNLNRVIGLHSIGDISALCIPIDLSQMTDDDDLW